MFPLADRITITAGTMEWFSNRGFIVTDHGDPTTFGVVGLIKKQIYHHVFYVVAEPNHLAVYMDTVTAACQIGEVPYENPEMLEVLEDGITTFAKSLYTTTPAG